MTGRSVTLGSAPPKLTRPNNRNVLDGLQIEKIAVDADQQRTFSSYRSYVVVGINAAGLRASHKLGSERAKFRNAQVALQGFTREVALGNPQSSALALQRSIHIIRYAKCYGAHVIQTTTDRWRAPRAAARYLFNGGNSASRPGGRC
jgi:hypothetical protein